MEDPYQRDVNGRMECFDGQCWFDERYACRHCQEPGKPAQFADERHSFGAYAGRYCDSCWAQSGYIDAGPEAFDPDYAGERLEADY